jgi:hypothetical protein
VTATDVAVSAWCGTCGAAFPLAEAVVAGTAGRCPRCATPFAAEGYTAVMTSAVRQILVAVDTLDGALRQLRDLAPALHVDERSILASRDG